ncbi:MAG: hypothetical protein BGN88_14085 [Clostridiales bacterium 43-6]|nr:MAG: hypothetical protein BGN88_14085 [Clostridiales bacterium 43-6]
MVLVISLLILTGMIFLQGIYKPGPNITPDISSNHPDQVNFLICGLDKSETLTDIIMVMCLDTKRETAHILQIPRDTFIGSEYDNTGKINGVYGHPKKGETKISTLANLIYEKFALPIDNYVTITIPGLRKVVDNVGGITIDVPNKIKIWDDSPETRKYVKIGPGNVTLDGYLAEGFVRNRASYDNADLGRVEANRLFYTAFLKKMQSLDFVKVTAMLNQCFQFISSDMKIEEITDFMRIGKYLKPYNIFFHALPGQSEDTVPPGLKVKRSYYSVHLEEYADILNRYMRPYDKTPIFVKDIKLTEIHKVYKKPDIDLGGKAEEYFN